MELLLLLLLYSRRINIRIKPDNKFTDYTGEIVHSVQWLCCRLKTEESWFDSLQEQEFSLSAIAPTPIVVPQAQLSSGYWGLFP